MGKIIELERKEIRNDAGELLAYSVIEVDLDDYKAMWNVACSELKINPNDTSITNKLQVFKKMGYEKYKDILMKEEGFEWLSETL